MNDDGGLNDGIGIFRRHFSSCHVSVPKSAYLRLSPINVYQVHLGSVFSIQLGILGAAGALEWENNSKWFSLTCR